MIARRNSACSLTIITRQVSTIVHKKYEDYKVLELMEKKNYLNIVILWYFDIKVNIWKATGRLAAKLEPEALKYQHSNESFSKTKNTKQIKRYVQTFSHLFNCKQYSVNCMCYYIYTGTLHNRSITLSDFVNKLKTQNITYKLEFLKNSIKCTEEDAPSRASL